MIAPLLLAFLFQGEPLTVRGEVRDAASGAPIADVRASTGTSLAWSDATGVFALSAARGDTVTIRRVGYRETTVVIGMESIRIALQPVTHALKRVNVVGSATAEAARVAAVRVVGEERAAAATSLADVVQRIPYVASRGARGEVVISMRAARSEQVLVLLDGLPLNDPATGVADLSDIPLAALGTVTATPGSDAARYGSGASGGVLSLNTANASVLAVHAGSFGARGIEGAAVARAADWSLRGGVHWSRDDADFPFVNDERSPDTLEHRVNAGVQRSSVFGSAVGPRLQLFALGTRAERGLGGAINNRSNDTVRETLRRLSIRLGAAHGDWRAGVGIRALDLTIRDPRRPTYGSDAGAFVLEADAASVFRGVAIRLGAAAERATGTFLDAPVRPRAHAAIERPFDARALRIMAAVRGDIVRDGGAHLSPSLAIERGGSVVLFARVAQGFRVPSFYDLYFASQSGVALGDVRPERVLLDAEAGVRATRGVVTASTSLFTRRTRDAIVWFPGFGLWSPQNVHRETARGVEGRVLAAARMWRLDAWGAAYSTRSLVDGIEIATPYVPRAAGGASARAVVGRFTLSASLSALGRRQFLLAPASRGSELPGVALGDAALAYRFPLRRASALLTVGVSNIADVRWESVRRYPTPGRSVTAALVLDSHKD